MDQCFVGCGPCGCSDNEGVTKADLDRFTDTIENVINDEKGRRLFRNFMYTSRMTAGRRSLKFLEDIEKLQGYKGSPATVTYRKFLNDLDNLIDAAERIEELDFAIMERLNDAREKECKELIIDVLKCLKIETAKTMRREYNAFRKHFIPPK